ncbi:hypothetical protein [Nocardioides sp. LML1-1-1.1]|uniref:hypothetical protein n=1 Tax=Nocardioides sp. LML1-1-1.1 TaxID=3135248 RepID=UPI003447534B
MPKKLVLLVLLALLGTLTPAAAPSFATAPTVEPPGTYFRSGPLAVYAVTPWAHLRIDRGGVNMPGATGPENLTWDAQVLRADMRAATPPPWRNAFTGTTVRSHVLAIAPGQVVCVRARQHSWGATSAWSLLTCVVRAREDQSVRRKGPVRVVTDGHYLDRRASILRSGTRMVIGGIPAGALYGPVFTKPALRPNGTVCAPPVWTIAGRRAPADAFGVSQDALHLWFHHTKVAGTAVVSSPYTRRCAVGGFVVVPRWVPRWIP